MKSIHTYFPRIHWLRLHGSSDKEDYSQAVWFWDKQECDVMMLPVRVLSILSRRSVCPATIGWLYIHHIWWNFSWMLLSFRRWCIMISSRVYVTIDLTLSISHTIHLYVQWKDQLLLNIKYLLRNGQEIIRVLSDSIANYSDVYFLGGCAAYKVKWTIKLFTMQVFLQQD